MKLYLEASVEKAVRARGFTGELSRPLPLPGTVRTLMRPDGEPVFVLGCVSSPDHRRRWSVYTTWES